MFLQFLNCLSVRKLMVVVVWFLKSPTVWEALFTIHNSNLSNQFPTIKKPVSSNQSLKLISPHCLKWLGTYFSFENDSFEGIKNNPGLLTAIQMSIINQAETLTRTMEAGEGEGEDTRVYQCSSCRLTVEEEDGEHPCSHCGQIMEVRGLIVLCI